MALQHSAGSLGTLGNYDLLEKVGEGSMGTVYRAAHWVTKEIVAVKVMPSHVARKPLLLKRFEQEFRLANRVQHPNVVRVLEYNGQEREPYLVMEFVEGASLGERLERQGRMAEEEALRLVLQVGEGLQHAHEVGLLHRDVKPDNILVTTDGVAKLTDLGLGKQVDATAELTRTGAGLGTPNFMPPEQFRDAKHADIRCDVYSLAATLYQMITGELPFGQGDPVRIMTRKLNNELTPIRQLAPEVSAQTEAAILRAMDPDPHRRTATCRAFLADLQGCGPMTPPPPQTEPAGANQDTVPADQLPRPTLMSSGAVRRRDMDTRLNDWTAQRSRPTAPGARPSPEPASPGREPQREAGVTSWRIPLSQPPQDAAARQGTGLSTERFLTSRLPNDEEPGGPPSAAPRQVPPPHAHQPGRGTDSWKTGLLIGVAGMAAVLLGQVLFALLR
jgi:serine/threonine protein kinase